MNKQELENKINELEKQLIELKEELNKPESKVWKPKLNDIYYTILNYGIISSSKWNDDAIDNIRYAIGNCFRTQEEAEFEVERLRVTAELKRFAEEHNEPIDWNNSKQSKYYIAFGADDSSICYGFAILVKRNDIYFSSKELAQQAVAEIGEERIKKYYLGIENEN